MISCPKFFRRDFFFWLCWGLTAAQAFPGGSDWGYSVLTVWVSCCGGFTCGALAPGHAIVSARGSAVVAHGLSCVAACAVFPGQGSNLFLLHWQADSTNEPPGKHSGRM